MQGPKDLENNPTAVRNTKQTEAKSQKSRGRALTTKRDLDLAREAPVGNSDFETFTADNKRLERRSQQEKRLDLDDETTQRQH